MASEAVFVEVSGPCWCNRGLLQERPKKKKGKDGGVGETEKTPQLQSQIF